MSVLGCRSWLGALNYYVLQWTGWRLACELDDNGKRTRWHLVRMRPGSGWNK